MSEPFSSNGKPTMQEQRAQWDKLTEKRAEMIAAEKQKREDRIKAEEESARATKINVQQEGAAALHRAEEREEWRQNQHVKRLEEAQEKIAEEAERAHQKKLFLQKQEEEKKKDEWMAELHRRAVAKKVEVKIEGAKLEESKQKKEAAMHEERQSNDVDMDLKGWLLGIDRNARKKSDNLRASVEKKRAQAEDRFKKLRGDESAKNEYKRSVMNYDSELEQGLFDIQTEAKKLKAEVQLQASQRLQRAHIEAEKKRRAAQARREGVEEWFGRKDKKLIKDSLDLS